MKPLFLVGYMGCGKSTLGRKLARRLGVDFIDTDALVEEREGASVADVFRYEGEERFREAERRVLDEVIAGASFAVVSTGATSNAPSAYLHNTAASVTTETGGVSTII